MTLKRVLISSLLLSLLSSCLTPLDLYPRTIRSRFQKIAELYWSPDRKQIAFTYVNYASKTSRSLYHSYIFVMNADGSNLQKLYHNISESFPAIFGWSQDGSGVFMIRRTPGIINPTNEESDQIAQGQSIARPADPAKYDANFYKLRTNGEFESLNDLKASAPFSNICLINSDNEQHLLYLNGKLELNSINLSNKFSPPQVISLKQDGTNFSFYRDQDIYCSPTTKTIFLSLSTGGSQPAFYSGSFRPSEQKLENVFPIKQFSENQQFVFYGWNSPSTFLFRPVPEPIETSSLTYTIQQYDVSTQQSHLYGEFPRDQIVLNITDGLILLEDKTQNMVLFDPQKKQYKTLINKNRDLPLDQATIIAE